MFVIGDNIVAKIFRATDILANGETLSITQPSELRGTLAVDFPAANSVDAGGIVEVIVPKTYSAGEKVINCIGADSRTDGVSIDTSFTISDGFYGTIRFMSNGVDEWRY